VGTETDWEFEDSIDSGALTALAVPPTSVDLRARWWTVGDQENTGSCVGWATADGVVRYHMKKAGKLRNGQKLSPRHVWMASKETDEFSYWPESFIEEAGTMLKPALDVARKNGVALEADLPFHIHTNLYLGRETRFYARCARRKITSYFNLNRNLANWKRWLANPNGGPILAGLAVDATWDNATNTGGKLTKFQPTTVRGGHAVCVVGYRADGRFIIRNSWGTSWGDKGFAYASPSYVKAAFFPEAYGVTM
jgi:C1A family cysteine protease